MASSQQGAHLNLEVPDGVYYCPQLNRVYLLIPSIFLLRDGRVVDRIYYCEKGLGPKDRGSMLLSHIRLHLEHGTVVYIGEL